MADGKWIEKLTAETPLVEAARHVLTVRLRVVSDHLTRAVMESERDPEHVHQLRVGTRRSDAALRLFKNCLPHDEYRAGRRTLRELRRAAGAARDWDVFLIELRERASKASAKEQVHLDFLRGYAIGQRVAAQSTLEAVGQAQLRSFKKFSNETIAALRPPHEPEDAVLLDQARPALAHLHQELDLAAAADLNDYAHLHQVRIAGKRLRYAMEVFACCFDQTFRDELYPNIELMQEILGRANDSHVATARLSGLSTRLKRDEPEIWSRLKASFTTLQRFHQRRLPLERKRFLKWWGAWTEHGSTAMLDLLAN